MIINHSIGNFLPIGSQCFTNHQFTNGTGKFTNSCQWFTIGSYWQLYMGRWGCKGGGRLFNGQNPLSMIKVVCRQSLGINRHHNFWNPLKIFIQVALDSKILLRIFRISPTYVTNMKNVCTQVKTRHQKSLL